METLKFKCTLLSDVILNVKSASEGAQQTLEFIPGSCFLGIVARKYAEFGNNAMTIFHSGKVRFGDAHLAIEDCRTLKIPASMYYPKLKKVTEACYIHHFYNRENDKEDNGGPQQLKQCRNGFYSFQNKVATLAMSDKSFAIKSAYDRIERRSKDSMMYGYESLNEGAEFYFSVEVDSEELAEGIAKSLCGIQKIGRSRTAQYGLVRIESFDFKESLSGDSYENLVTIYADGRLIFFDENGVPTFQPTAEDFGIKEGRIVWEKSQIRTFQYSPWNFKRQCFDTDRCGIEKGSVFVVENAKDCPQKSQYVGCYRNEGFGKVIYNPDFLDANISKNGFAEYKIEETKEASKKQSATDYAGCDSLLSYLTLEKKKQEETNKVYEIVNKFVTENKGIFTQGSFASQWGNIRSIAMQHPTKQEILFELFDKTIVKKSKDKNKQDKTIPYAYLTHGIGQEKWQERGRFRKLKSFIENDCIELSDEAFQFALINLAAEMAKRCSK